MDLIYEGSALFGYLVVVNSVRPSFITLYYAGTPVLLNRTRLVVVTFLPEVIRDVLAPSF